MDGQDVWMSENQQIGFSDIRLRMDFIFFFAALYNK